MKKNVDSETSYSKKFLKNTTKSYCDEATDIHDKAFPELYV